MHPVDDIEEGETEREQVPDTKSILFLKKNLWIFNWSIDSSSHSKLTFSASASSQAFVVFFHLKIFSFTSHLAQLSILDTELKDLPVNKAALSLSFLNESGRIKEK